MSKSKIVIAVALLVLILAACSPPVPTTVPEPTTESLPTLTPTPQPQDTSWQQVQSAGVLRVGTSADYPPFASYDENHQMVGFDIALIQQIGQRLGLPVEIVDYGFDGLPMAVATGDVDVVIGAISITPERQSIANFSNVYYISTDAVLSRPEANPANLQNPAALAASRLGVQLKSIYETYAQEKLIDTGLMPKQNLFVYIEAAQAVDALKAKTVDAVWMDLAPAQKYVDSTTVKILTQDLNQQLYAIGMKKGADALVGQINNALTQLQNDGTLNNMIVQYFGIEPEDIIIPPTMTPTPPQPTQKPPECLNNAKFIKDLSYDDNDMKDPPVLNAGQPFTKGWRLQNNGGCTWKNGVYKLVYSYGNVAAAQMGGQPVPVTKDVKPGETFDFQVNLIAPVKPGEYEGYWNMRDAQNVKFGQTVWVNIKVVGAATPTPPPTPTAVPNITFTAKPTTITAGQGVLFDWAADNVKAVYLYHDGQNWWEREVEKKGSATDYPSRTMTYHLLVVQNNGTEVDRPILITVYPAPDEAPVIEYLAASPPQIRLGESVSIDWKVGGDVHTAVLFVDNVAVMDPAPVQGNYVDTPPSVGERVYKLSVTGPAGDDVEQVRVNVQPQPTEEPVEPTPTPEPTEEPAPQAPEIWGFEVTPTNIEQGQSVTASWTTGGGTTYVQLLRNDQVIWEDAALNNSVPDTPPAEAGATIRYVLVAYNNAGQSDSREAIVRVAEAPPQNLLANTTWQLKSMQGVEDIPGEVTITAYFGADGGLSGSSGCNSYSASYASNGQEIIINTPSGGGQACGEPFDSLEQGYLGLLPQTANFEMNGNLVLRGNTGQVILRFSRIG